ncbi:MAG TPA: tRNA preQ1(34) S-adenosylmethionine ribosyltransferase-isomerase QueA [candidate division WOR-3 bacterium]|uniref:S-adenosylmethionine:tRNA ribosyltransferase-isomerase n=1 Tax=candidate division WOR-3 bacterium TaxID=2052148 RepID=A0A7V0T4G6_UNCW3|nr:tRNA preQ1(34) S-adenosylmethionine ribosyltransferase-isomerase QueA [candidate division WOR-3 bacterium]
MLVADFDYDLPPELIAQEPAPARDESRLLVLDRATGDLHDHRFPDIRHWLRAGDVLVMNDTRVIPARIFGTLPTGGRLELLLLRRRGDGCWEALSRPARKAREGTLIRFDGASARVRERLGDGIRIVEFDTDDVPGLLERVGELALPPYIRRRCEEPDRYQTVYARLAGAVAAPTAGLHFTPALIAELAAAGVETAIVTLHAGLGTFRPVKAETVAEHRMHPEEFELGSAAADTINRALAEGRRVVCVGTTSVRVVESQARETNTGRRVEPGAGDTALYIYPGYEWRVTGALLTNFHLPRSTLLMLVSALAGRQCILAAYRHAVEQRYRFYSFGDAMLIV